MIRSVWPRRLLQTGVTASRPGAALIGRLRVWKVYTRRWLLPGQRTLAWRPPARTAIEAAGGPLTTRPPRPRLSGKAARRARIPRLSAYPEAEGAPGPRIEARGLRPLLRQHFEWIPCPPLTVSPAQSVVPDGSGPRQMHVFRQAWFSPALRQFPADGYGNWPGRGSRAGSRLAFPPVLFSWP